jgi:hypothetical protein
MYAKSKDGSLLYNAGNLAIHVISVDFVERLNQGGLSSLIMWQKRKWTLTRARLTA